MATSSFLRASYPHFFKLAVCLLLLVSPVAKAKDEAKDEVFLDVLSANSSTVELSCRYVGEKKGLFFNVYSGPKACIFYESFCQYYPREDCNLQCKDTDDMNEVQFLVNLEGNCQEKVQIRCSVKSLGEGQHLDLDVYRILKAQSDTPEISVNNGQRVYFEHEPVPVVCRVPNRCTTAMLEISGNGTYMSSLEKTDSKEGVRYNTTLNTAALFKNAGNYTITCKEIGNESYSSTNLTFEVHNKSTDESLHEKLEPTGKDAIISITTVSAIAILIFILTICLSRRKWKPFIKRLTRKHWRSSIRSVLSLNSDEEALLGSENDEGIRAVTQIRPIDRLLWDITIYLNKEGTLDSDIVATMTNLVRKGANPFAPLEGTTAFSLFLEESSSNKQESLIPLVSEFIEEAFKGRFMNYIIRSIPNVILEENSSHISAIKEVILKKCLDMIDEDPALRDHKDNEGKTPLHNLLEKLLTEDAWQDMFKLTEESDDRLWHLISELITTTNVNMKDKKGRTPYSWISYWKETLLNAPDSKNVSRKIDRILDSMEGANRGDALQGLTYIREKQKKKNVLKLRNSICGICSKYDEDIEKKISLFIERRQNPKKVHTVKMEKLSFLQSLPVYTGYFAVISSPSLRNDNFCIYLMTVLRCLSFGTMNNKSTLVLVVADKDAVSLLDDARNKTIHWPIDLEAIPRVDVNSQVEDDHLHQVALKLQGPRLIPGCSLSNGNVGIGFAWGVFQYNFAFMLPGIRDRINKSTAKKIYGEKMGKHYIIIIPESYEMDLKIQKQGLRSTTNFGHLDNANKIHRAGWSPYRSEESVFETKNSQGEKLYFCGKYLRHHSAFKYLLESGELTEEDMKKQHLSYTDTIKSILRDPIYHDNVLFLCLQDYDSLPDKLCDLITKEDVEQCLSIETNPRKQVTRVAEGLAWSYYRRYVDDIGPGLVKAMKETELYKQKRMPARYFILLPYSCVIHYNVDDADKEHIKNERKLKWNKRVIPVYKISSAQENYFACVSYRAEAGILHEMETGEPAALTPMQRAAELRIFYEMLNHLFTRPSAPDSCRIVRLIYYDDDENTGRKLSEILVDEIKESLQEEGRT